MQLCRHSNGDNGNDSGNYNQKFSYRIDSSRCGTALQGHSRSSVDVPIDAVYNFLLALNSNLTSIFNCSWDITPSVHIYTPPLFQVELEKDR